MNMKMNMELEMSMMDVVGTGKESRFENQKKMEMERKLLHTHLRSCIKCLEKHSEYHYFKNRQCGLLWLELGLQLRRQIP